MCTLHIEEWAARLRLGEDMAAVKQIRKEVPPVRPRGSGPSDSKSEWPILEEAVCMAKYAAA